jgi:hypothetical protein
VRCASQKAGAGSGRHHEASNANEKPLCLAAPAQLGSWALRGLVWRLGRHGSARGWLMAESWRHGWGEAGRSGSAQCCAPASMPSSRRPRPRARTPWGIGAPESFVEASCAAVSPESRGSRFVARVHTQTLPATPQPRGYPEATSLLSIDRGQHLKRTRPRPLLYLNLPQANSGLPKPRPWGGQQRAQVHFPQRVAVGARNLALWLTAIWDRLSDEWTRSVS